MGEKNHLDRHNKLMLCFQSGDESAFQSLFSSYKNRVFELTVRFFQNQQIAEQVTQDVFLRLYFTKDSFRADVAFPIWLFSIVNQICQNYGPIAPVSEVKNAKKSYLQEAQHTIRLALAKLSGEERMVFLLDHCEKMSIPEISEVLNKNPLAVETILFRVRANLRIKLAAYLELVGGG